MTYIEVTVGDIALANRLAHEVLGRTLDELAPQTRRLLLKLEEMATAACAEKKLRRTEFRFSRRELRETTGWGNTQLKVHLGRLVDFEYLVVHRGRRGPSFEYELLYDGQGKDGSRFFCGLIDVAEVAQKHGYDAERSGQNGERSGSGRPPVGPRSGGGRGEPIEGTARPDAENASSNEKPPENADPGSPAPEGRRTHSGVVPEPEDEGG
jgi:hypothetical protein